MSPVRDLVYSAGAWRGRAPGDVVTPPAPPPSATTYRPLSFSNTTQMRAGLAIPASANLVMWPSADPQAMFINDVAATLGANDILVLPEANKRYLVDTDVGFINDPTHYYEMIRFRRGMAGMGIGTEVDLGSRSGSFPFTQAPQTAADGGCKERIIGCWGATGSPGYFGNFVQYGRDLGGVAYHALTFSATGGTYERIWQRGAFRGFRNSPGGESGGLCSNGSNSLIKNCEVDCRDPLTGRRVASSPFMFNSCSNVTVLDSYMHHAVAGMPTCHNVTNANYARLRSEYNGSGNSQYSGSALNFEMCAGTVNIDDCTLICNYQNNYSAAENSPPSAGLGNVGGHVGGGSSDFSPPLVGQSVVFNIRNPTFDWGSDGSARVGGHRFDFQFQPTYGGMPQKQLNTDFHVTNAAGQPIAFKVRS